MPPREDEVQTLVEQLSAELERSVLVDDASLRLLAYSPTLGSDDEVRRTAILTRETPRVIRDLHFSQGIATATKAVRTASRSDFGLESRVCVPIRCQGTLFGYLWLIDGDQSLTDEDCELAERCASEIGTAMYRRQELERPRREQERRLLEALLGPDPAARDEASHELLAADLIVGGTPIGALCMRPGSDGELGPAEKARLGLALDQFRRALGVRQSLSVVRAEHGVVLVAVDSHVQRAGGLKELARRLQEALEQTVAGAGPARVALGYSEQAEHLSEAHRAYGHARLALRVAISAPEHGSPAGWADLGAFRMLARLADAPNAEELLHPGLPQLFELQSKESLVATLEAYLDNGCDTKLTAEALFLHRASLYYRLQRIEQLTGTSLKSGADRLALHASLKLARLLGMHPARRRLNSP
ncbi:helix-turn-helix domain-containing protein [Candidatus Solirubrobacter pratensis]|uniref:helix-turn-helix domain-containing protein n=1 Tax=Candidatus Solirubrobacter pratensis TaxID=1298857 RepID=UPI0004062866|nr:helix-turn-helix domain-containing protein [Candidatus Solirubrobacter pratensis]